MKTIEKSIGYVFKNKELLKDLTDKLKLSDNFKKTNKF